MRAQLPSRLGPGRPERRRWCLGRIGVDHEIVTMYPPNFPDWVTRRHDALCGPSEHRWSRSHWTCHHVVMCAVCDRIFREYLGQECPRYDAALLDVEISAEHWPTDWVSVPVQITRQVDLEQAAGRTSLALDLRLEHDEVELWMPLRCTCGAETPCRYLGDDRRDETTDAALMYALRSADAQDAAHRLPSEQVPTGEDES